MWRGAMQFPKLFWQLRLVVLQSLRCPRLEGRQAHLLWLRGAVCDDGWRIGVECQGHANGARAWAARVGGTRGRHAEVRWHA